MKRRWTVFPLIIAGIVILFQFFGSEKFVNPETGKKTRVAFSPEQEETLGLQSYQQVLSQSDVITSGPEVEQVVKVANRLATATGDAARTFNWEVSVIRSPQANAFCLPGGKIAVYTGILPYTKDEAGLATVMGHEMAHATSRHASQRILQHQAMQTAMMGVQGSVGNMDPGQQQMILGLLGVGAQFGVLLPFSRDHEKEADEIGLTYMARAGYDPRESVSFWQRMESAGGRQPPEFMSTHPSHETRIERLKQFMPRAIAEYEKSKAR